MDYIPYLRKAREFIANGWTKGALARTRAGLAVSVDDERAVRFCIVGAMDKVTPHPFTDEKYIIYIGMRDRLEKVLRLTSNNTFLHKFNDADSTKKTHVLSLFDKTIAVEETNEQP